MRYITACTTGIPSGAALLGGGVCGRGPTLRGPGGGGSERGRVRGQKRATGEWPGWDGDSLEHDDVRTPMQC